MYVYTTVAEIHVDLMIHHIIFWPISSPTKLQENWYFVLPGERYMPTKSAKYLFV